MKGEEYRQLNNDSENIKKVLDIVNFGKIDYIINYLLGNNILDSLCLSIESIFVTWGGTLVFASLSNILSFLGKTHNNLLCIELNFRFFLEFWMSQELVIAKKLFISEIKSLVFKPTTRAYELRGMNVVKIWIQVIHSIFNQK